MLFAQILKTIKDIFKLYALNIYKGGLNAGDIVSQSVMQKKNIIKNKGAEKMS